MDDVVSHGGGLDKTFRDLHYAMDKEERGVALIFNNRNFTRRESFRDGSDKDVDSLSYVLNRLYGFEIHLWNDADAFDMRREVRKFAQRDHSRADCFVMVIMSHGEADGKVHCVLDANAPHKQDAHVSLHELTDLFNDCESLKGKPKIFIVQTCRGDKPDMPVQVPGNHSDHSDGPNQRISSSVDASDVADPWRQDGGKTGTATHQLAPGPDFLYAFPTAPGCISFRKTDGSWFIQTLSGILRQSVESGQDGTIDLARILTLVSWEVAAEHAPARAPGSSKNGAKQAPTTKSSLTKLLFLTKKSPKKIFHPDFTQQFVQSFTLNVDIPDTPDSIITQQFLNGITTTVRKGHYRELGGRLGATVVAKQIQLDYGPGKEKIRESQVNALDALLQNILTVEHPNLVRHLGVQAVVSEHADRGTMPLSVPYYQIIMEHLPGGTLTELISRSGPLPLERVTEIGFDVLSGIARLHDQSPGIQSLGIRHKAIFSDHIVFTGPQPGEGRAKLVSLHRIQIPKAVSSYMKMVEPLPCPPPEIKVQSGRPTDIWAFGCLLLHMLTGEAPLDKGGKFISPPWEWLKEKAESCPDADLRGVIRDCLQEAFDARPSADALLHRAPFTSFC